MGWYGGMSWALGWLEGIAGDVVKWVSQLACLEFGLGFVKAVYLQFSAAF